MRHRKALLRWLTGWLLLSMLGVGLLGGVGLSVRAAPKVQAATNIVISEFRTRGPGSASNEFIELYNPTSNFVDITNWMLRKSSGCGATLADIVQIGLTGPVNLSPGQYYLIARSPEYNGSTPPDLLYTTTIADDGGIALLDQTSAIVDQVGMCNNTTYKEGTFLSKMSGTSDQSYERKLGGADGNCIDLGDNSKDFIYHDGSGGNTSNPQNSFSPPVACGIPPTPPIEVLINEIAWAGTQASSDDDWVELYNPSQTAPVDISDWELIASNFSITFPNPTIIPPDGYYLIERRQQATNVTSSLVFSGLLLGNSGDILRLRKPDGTIIDTANINGGGWPAGDPATTATMQRGSAVPDSDLAWVTYDSPTGTDLDAASRPILGTPGRANQPTNVTATSTPTQTPTSTNTPTPTQTPTSTSTFTPPPTLSPVPTAARTIVINEIAWAGTQSSSDDEWIELYNPSNRDVNLTDWNLVSSDGNPNIEAEFKDIVLKSGEYLLLERTDDDPTNIKADVIYSGSFNNNGEILRLYDPNGFLVDSANSNGGAWPAGNASTFAAMERSVIAADSDFVWVTYDITKDTGTKAKDASGNDIKGTPKRANVPINVTPTATPRNTTVPGSSGSGSTGATSVPLQPVIGISEFLPRPGYDWNNDGKVDVFDEFIEIINAGRLDINLSAYQLDDEEGLGSAPYNLPSITLKPDERAVFYASETGILLSDAGDTVRLLRGSTVVDAYTYPVVRYPDQSWCRLPDRMGYWNDPCFPTPNNPNALTGTIPSPPETITGYRPPVCLLPDTTPAEFVFAECDAGGGDIWNRQYWDEADASQPVKLDEGQKGETIFK